MTDVADQSGQTGSEVHQWSRSSPDSIRLVDLVDHAVDVPIAQLRIGSWPRRGDLRPEHVNTLAELDGRWPPIVVSRSSHEVIDGRHRVEAARLLGHTTISAHLFAGSSDDAYIVSIRQNVQHGLPLTLAERRDAASRILGVHRSWSDRRIAAICGLAPGTVGTLRARRRIELDENAGEEIEERRVGRDGRSRPVDAAAARERVAQALTRNPGRSLRRLGSEVRSSPETVRSVRAEIERRPESQWWQADTALSSTDAGKKLVAWLGRANIDRSVWMTLQDSVPLSRVYDLAAEARRRADEWTAFADQLEQRAHHTSS
jgi:ParB-like chromosome segregation protein Spo0J